MKIAILQLNLIVGDFFDNYRKIIAGYKKACALGAELVVGTELMLFGYPPRDLLLRKGCLEMQDQYLQAIAEHVGPIGLILGAALRNNWNGKPLFNSAVLIQNGALQRNVNKKLLPEYDVFEERLYFEPGNPESSNIIPYDPKLEKGSAVLPDEYIELAVIICEDGWGGTKSESGEKLYEHDPLATLAFCPPKMVIAINASPYSWGKGDIRFDLVSGIAKRLGCPVIYANQVGGNDELVFDGRSFVVDANGNCIGVAKTFEEDILFVDFDNPVLAKYPSDTKNMKDLHDALVLGIRDYCRKTGFTQTVIGLSGGIDSAVTAALAVQALGNENVLGVSMSSPYSSGESAFDAHELAENLKIKLKMASIEYLYRDAIRSLQVAINWHEPDEATGSITDQNIQARLRGLTLMAISNREGRLVLATGNKSEIAVGYCTLYGDMCGGFAPISDLPKTLVYRLADYINLNGEVIPQRTITKPPSAELAPDQKDTDSLPPYEILDPILRLYIEEQMDIREIAWRGFDETVVRDVIQKVNRAEYKRRQMAPGLKVTDKAFGTGRRMPIAAKYPL
jgi:NAD+ synthase (glutamine-hydrolysing)